MQHFAMAQTGHDLLHARVPKISLHIAKSKSPNTDPIVHDLIGLRHKNKSSRMIGQQSNSRATRIQPNEVRSKDHFGAFGFQQLDGFLGA